MKNIIITAIGSDRPGIVSQISKIITNCGGNVKESKMSKMGIDFVIIMLVSIPKDTKKILCSELNIISDLIISIKDTKEVTQNNQRLCRVELNGADNEGIVQVLTEYLSAKLINIIELDTNITSAPVTGTQLFNLKANVTLPDNVNINEIQIELDHISRKLSVDLSMHES